MKNFNLLVAIFIYGNSIFALEEALTRNATDAVIQSMRESRTKWRGSDNWKQKIQIPGAQAEIFSKDSSHVISNEPEGSIKVVSQFVDQHAFADLPSVSNDYMLKKMNQAYLSRLLAILADDKGLDYNRNISDTFTKCHYTHFRLGSAFLLGNTVLDMTIECISTFDKDMFLARIK